MRFRRVPPSPHCLLLPPRSPPPSSAVADYDAVISLDPYNAHAYHNRGISRDKQARTLPLLLCVVCRTHALPSHPPTQGAYEAAVADFTRVLELDATCVGP